MVTSERRGLKQMCYVYKGLFRTLFVHYKEKPANDLYQITAVIVRIV